MAGPGAPSTCPTPAPLAVAAILIACVVASCGDEPDRPGAPSAATPATAPGTRPATTPATLPSGRPTIERAQADEPPPALRLAIELNPDNPYVGEPLSVRVYLSSPRADAALDAAAGAPGPATRPAESPLAPVGRGWPDSIRFDLRELRDDAPRATSATLDWPRLRVPATPLAAHGVGNPFADWLVPASVALPAGQYVLRVTWAGAAGPIDASGLSAEARFTIAAPTTDAERAEHAERLALLAYREGRFADARRLVDEAVKADRTSTTPQRVQALLAQADACLALDDLRAGLDVYRSILKMPLDERLAADLTAKARLLEELLRNPRPRPATRPG